MNFKEYQKRRAQLIASAESFIHAGKVEEARKAREDAEELDRVWENLSKEQANIRALQGNRSGKPVESQQQNQSAQNEHRKAREDQRTHYRAFVKKMMGKPLTSDETDVFERINSTFLQTAAGELNTRNGNEVVIPQTLVNQIWEKMEQEHPVIADLNATKIKGNIIIAKEDDDGGPDADFYDENTEVKGEKIKIGNVTLTGYELSKMVEISWTMKEMSIDDFANYLMRRIAKRMGSGLAKAIISGKGIAGESDSFKSQPRGILTALASSEQVNTYDTQIAFTDVTKMFSKLSSGASPTAAIYANSETIWNQLANIVNQSGDPIFITDPVEGGVGRIFGKIVKEESTVPTDTVILGSITDGYALNANKDITIMTEEKMPARKTSYMGYAIIDGNVMANEYFSVLKKQ